MTYKFGTVSVQPADGSATLDATNTQNAVQSRALNVDLSSQTGANILTVPLSTYAGEYSQDVDFVLLASANSAILRVTYGTGSQTAQITGVGGRMTFRYNGETWQLSSWTVPVTLA